MRTVAVPIVISTKLRKVRPRPMEWGGPAPVTRPGLRERDRVRIAAGGETISASASLRMASRTVLLLWLPRLSMSTISSGPQRGHEHLADVGEEAVAVDASIEDDHALAVLFFEAHMFISFPPSGAILGHRTRSGSVGAAHRLRLIDRWQIRWRKPPVISLQKPQRHSCRADSSGSASRTGRTNIANARSVNCGESTGLSSTM